MADKALDAAGIVKTFPGTVALDHVSITLARGEVHALVGENGSGKSTLVKVLSGVYRPDAGRVLRGDRPLRVADPSGAHQAGIRAVYQEDDLIPALSLARNLFLGFAPRNRLGLLATEPMHECAAEILPRFGVPDDVRRPLRTLDEGRRKLVALARAVTAGAQVILLDEPTALMERAEIEALFGAVAAYRDQGGALLFVSHRLDEVDELSDRITVLRQGRVGYTGRSDRIDRRTLVSALLGRRLSLPAPCPDDRHQSPADPPFLQATGLTRKHALTGVSIELRQGEVVGLGGLHGAGRTETAKAIAGALPLDAGQVTVAGAPLRRRSITGAIRAGVSLLPENRTAEGIIPALSVRDNIALAALPRLARFGLVSNARIDRVVETFMRRLQIQATSPHQKAGELSGGNQQKVLLARWLAMHPKVLLLDEPTHGIDIGAKAQLRDLLDELAASGLAILLISSDLDDLVNSCDRVVVLRDGAVTAELAGRDVTEAGIISAMAAAGRPT